MSEIVYKNSAMRQLGVNAGLYLHIPWCRQICHYCDFAKTANHSQDLRLKFLATLEAHVTSWFSWRTQRGDGKFSSVFFGGGTPSVYTSDYIKLMSLIGSQCQSTAEITLEANPDDISAESLKIWRGLGFNRISLGVQTFDETGLKAMHRVHSKDQAIKAVDLALSHFPTVNIDLIYGWQGQSMSSWESDLRTASTLKVPHLSLYNLTYEPRTVIGRMAARGKIEPADDLRLEAYYKVACEQLATAGFVHEEVSNWALPNHSCAHNWLYWSDQPYIGVGPGAHGYIPESTGIGRRYAYGRNERQFTDSVIESAPFEHTNFPVPGVVLEDDRTMMSWIIEAIGSSLRTERGVDLARIAKKSGQSFRPGHKIESGLKSGALKLSDDGERLIATPAEWFREHYWALAVIDGFE